MINYRSTRGNEIDIPFSGALLAGIAGDGGLFVPGRLPHVDRARLQALRGASYRATARTALDLFETDLSAGELDAVVERAYGRQTRFDDPRIAPLVGLGDRQFILELWHGPTSAFKDLALQIMPLLFHAAIRQRGSGGPGRAPRRHLILVATSGDTGKAALEGYRDLEGVDILVFYPKAGVSRLQALALQTQGGDNVGVYGVDGDFDDAQRVVKQVFADQSFRQGLLQRFGTALSSANSINWGRLLPQTVYYLSSYLDLVEQGALALGDEVDYVVPTGNFGNILAGYYARRMGLPIRRLVCASNQNNVLTDFLQTGVYDIRARDLVKTPSPSMDILVASNIERLLYELTRDPERVALWMEQLRKDRVFAVDADTLDQLQRVFHSDFATNEACLQHLATVFENTGYLMDPHTSVAHLVAEHYEATDKARVPIVIVSTAHWSKFAGDVWKALARQGPGGAAETLHDLQTLAAMSAAYPQLLIPSGIRELPDRPIRFDVLCKADVAEVEGLIHQYLETR